MNTQTGAPAGSEAMAASTPATDANPRSLSDMIAEARQAPESAEPATEPDNEIPAQAENAAPAEEQPSGEVPEAAEPAELPPIDPPRSWTQAEKERFQSLPRETQEYLHTREQEREREFRRSQNEVAEQRKAVEAETQKAEQTRKNYEAKLASVMQTLHDSSPFADIKSMADVEKMQAEDPFRFQQFQVYQWKMQATQQELQQAEQRKTQETQTKWAEHVQAESAKFAESLPDADKAKLQQFTGEAPKFLAEKGFTEKELADFASGKDRLSIYDHRVQSLILDGMKYREAKNAKPVALATVPPVQRPGTAQPRGSVQSEAFTRTSAKIDNGTGDHRDLSALLGAMRRA
jgi:hypothetical protein